MATATRKKPKKPYAEFPLFPHANGLWSKKIKGRLYYFGKWDDADAALKKFLEERDDLYAGRKPRRSSGDGIRMDDLCNRFLTTKRRLLDTGEIVGCTFHSYYKTCERMVAFFGTDRRVDDLDADDFETLRADIAKTRGPVALGCEITRVRVLMKYAFDQGLIPGQVRYGQSFRKPSKKAVLQQRNERGPKMFEAAQLRLSIEKAGLPLKAMILLGINCGFGPTDLARLQMKNLDLKKGWIDYARPKTGVQRRCPLWPETIAALKEAIAARVEPKNPANSNLVFLTCFGLQWCNTIANSAISQRFRKLLRKLKIHRSGIGFYALRHGFETVGGDSRDQIAVDHIMGHSRNDMASVYRESISDERLRAVAEHVRGWLFPKRKRK